MAVSDHAPAPRRSILVVDDMEAILRFIQRGLGRNGWDVHTASSRAAALGMARQERYALILLDIHMPGPSLRETITAFRHALRETPILLMTGGADEAVIEEGLSLGAFGPLWKPIGLAELKSRIDRLLDGDSRRV